MVDPSEFDQLCAQRLCGLHGANRAAEITGLSLSQIVSIAKGEPVAIRALTHFEDSRNWKITGKKANG